MARERRKKLKKVGRGGQEARGIGLTRDGKDLSGSGEVREGQARDRLNLKHPLIPSFTKKTSPEP